MSTVATAFKAGNSVVVALPPTWRKANGVQAGDKVVLDDSVSGEITFRKASEEPKAGSLADLVDFIESLPAGEWPWGDSKEDDRALLAERYA